jgi:YfiH family protein
MSFHTRASIRYYSFDLLERAGINHAIFTRRGGVSPHPWDSLNVGGTVGDAPTRVIENRIKAFKALDRPPDSVYDVWQVHGKDFVLASQPRAGSAYKKADIIITNRPEVTLFMRFADCVPIMLVDPIHRAVGLVHAGWQGTIKKIVIAAIEAMVFNFGSDPEDLLAGIGPSIGPNHYEVGPEVANQVISAFGNVGNELLLPVQDQIDPSEKRRGLTRGDGISDNYRVKFDLWAANRIQLEKAGVRMIEESGICTACHMEDWYSHRGENGRTGRFGALITPG